MQKFFICLILGGQVFLGLSQETILISGQLIDSETKVNLAFVNVSLLKQVDGTLTTGTITDEEGRFELTDIPLGQYDVVFSILGYSATSRQIVAGGLNNIFNLGKVPMSPSTEQLNEVEVIAQEAVTSSSLEKKSFAIENNIAQAGGSVMDAMKSLPGISFDQEGKVILRGSDKVMVLIDGKQSSLTGFGNQKGLASIPASNIEKVEIINNPSAKFDASGFAGIINIIYKEEKTQGVNGDFSLSFGLGSLGKRRIDTPTDLGSFSVNPKFLPSLNINYKEGQINYFLQSDFILQEALPNNEFTTRNYDDGRMIQSQVPENRKQFRTILKGGVDWDLDEQNSITIAGMFDREKHVDTAQVAFLDLNSNRRTRYYNWKENEITRFINTNVGYTHSFNEPGHLLEFGMQYTQGLEDETYSLNDSSSVRIGKDRTNIKALEHTSSFSLDYRRPLSHGKMETGGKMRIRRLPVDYLIAQGENSIIYPGLGTFSKWGENLYALYGNYVLEQKYYDIEAGLRTEYTTVFYNLDPLNTYYPENDAYNYFEVFPNFRFTYKINEQNRLSFFYNRRIDRPGEPELRIFPKYDDPELLKVGNPYLRPQLTNSFEVAHKFIWDTGSLFSALYHRITDDPYLRIYSIDDTETDYNIVNRIYQNVGSARNTGIELLWSQKIGNHLNLSASINAYLNGIDPYSGTLLFPETRTYFIQKSSDEAWDGKLSIDYILKSQYSIQVSTIYQSQKNIPQGEQLGRTSFDLGVKKYFKNKWEATLSATDLFNTFGIRQNLRGNGFTTEYQNYYETQIIRLGLKYKL